MTPGITALDRYKLNSVFHGDGIVIHTTYKSDLLGRQRRVELRTSWKREKELGSGAFGVVWREREQGSGQLRAVKIVSKIQLNVREVEALVELQDHPDLFILFLGWFEDPHAIHIAMEYIEHGDLGQYMKDGVKAKTEAKEITSQILEGLAVLHEREICHRDLKPQNILIASPSPIWVKITDFGISKRSMGTSLRSGCGTVCYQAPEQLGLLPRNMRTSLKDSYTKVVDLWALGAVVHEILTSEIPFLDTYQDLDWTMDLTLTPDLSSASNPDPTIDMNLLQDYCRGINPFPRESLRKNGVSKEGIDFVKSLMAVNPRDRVSATDALKSLWLLEINPLKVDPTGIDPELLRSQFQLLEVRLTSEDTNRLSAETDRATIIDILHSPVESKIWDLQCAAVSAEYLEVIKLLLRVIDRNDINSQPQLKSRPLLMLAARNGKVSALKLLLDCGANVNATPAYYNGRTALQAAAERGHLGAMKLLLDRRADVNMAPASYGGRTALQAAAEGGHLDAMKLLLGRGADINATSANDCGRSALQAAAGRGRIVAANILLDRGANINAAAGKCEGRTALQAAAEGGHVDALKLLLGRGADLNAAAAEYRGRTALHAAVLGRDLGVVELLLGGGANVCENALSSAKNNPTFLATLLKDRKGLS